CRTPTAFEMLKELLVVRRQTFARNDELYSCLNNLVSRGLVGWDSEGGQSRFDLHPIVRGVVWDRTDAADRKKICTALTGYFQKSRAVEWDEIRTVEDLTPAIELFNSSIEQKDYDYAYS